MGRKRRHSRHSQRRVASILPGRLVKTAAIAAQGNQLSTLHLHYRTNPEISLIILRQSHLVKSCSQSYLYHSDTLLQLDSMISFQKNKSKGENESRTCEDKKKKHMKKTKKKYSAL